MKKETFFKDLSELLEVDETVSAETDLSNLEEFDSLAVMGLVAYADRKLSLRITADMLGKVTTVASLMNILGEEHFE